MSDDALIPGAAAPEVDRRIHSIAVLDALWVVVAAIAMIVSSFFALVDLPSQSLRTGAEPLRVWVLGLPVGAMVVAVVGAVRRSIPLVAMGTGVLAPSVAFVGSLSLSLFLDDASAFADGGVAVSLGAAFVGAVMLLRWFVYHPADVVGDESRPRSAFALVVTACGVALGATVLVGAIDDARSASAAVVSDIAAMLIVAFVVVGAGLLRTRPAVALAGGAAGAQLVAVTVMKLEQSSLPLDSRFLLRSGVVGVGLCMATIVACSTAWARHGVDDVPADTDDDPDWRWSFD